MRMTRVYKELERSIMSFMERAVLLRSEGSGLHFMSLPPASAALSHPAAPGGELARFFGPHARARERTAEFFGAEIRNPNTRAAYRTAVSRFAGWAEARGLALTRLRPLEVAAYIEQL